MSYSIHMRHLFYACDVLFFISISKCLRTQLEIGWGKKIQVELKREPGASFGVCIVGGTVLILCYMIYSIRNLLQLVHCLSIQSCHRCHHYLYFLLTFDIFYYPISHYAHIDISSIGFTNHFYYSSICHDQYLSQQSFSSNILFIF